jgi:hypothetical protein
MPCLVETLSSSIGLANALDLFICTSNESRKAFRDRPTDVSLLLLVAHLGRRLGLGLGCEK